MRAAWHNRTQDVPFRASMEEFQVPERLSNPLTKKNEEGCY